MSSIANEALREVEIGRFVLPTTRRRMEHAFRNGDLRVVVERRAGWTLRRHRRAERRQFERALLGMPAHITCAVNAVGLRHLEELRSIEAERASSIESLRRSQLPESRRRLRKNHTIPTQIPIAETPRETREPCVTRVAE